MNDILSIFIEAGPSGCLSQQFKQQRLFDTLRSVGPFTVFAPDEEAFDKIPKAN